LAEREAKIDQELQSDLADSMSETGPGLGTAGFRPVSVTRSTV
jgi:hypothetical protein